MDTEREGLLASALGRLSLANSRRLIRFMQTILPRILTGEGSTEESLTGQRYINQVTSGGNVSDEGYGT